MGNKLTKKELIQKLKTISEDVEFITGVISMASQDNERIQIIRYIDKGEDISYEQLLLLALSLKQTRKEKNLE